MKYWNKDKHVRQQCWTKVKMNIRFPCYPYDLVKRDLQLNPSPGKFYMYHASDYVWFEHEKDAAWFALKWS